MSSRSHNPQDQASVLDKLEELSNILDAGLDRETLSTVKALCEQGVNPQALAQVIKYLRREGAVTSTTTQ